MNVLPAILRREFAQLVRSAHGLGPLFLALAGAGGLFIFFVRRAEGTAETLPALWGLASAFGLPFLAASAASRGFTQDREVGMLRLMFATPVRARWWVLGKVLAAWVLCLLYVGGMGLGCWAWVRWLVPAGAQLPMGWLGFALASGALAVQALLWCGIGTLVSLFSRSSASTFLLSLLACLFAPPVVCLAASALTPGGGVQWPWFPLQTVVYDCAGGLVDVRALLACLMASAVLVYAAGLMFDALRLCATER